MTGILLGGGYFWLPEYGALVVVLVCQKRKSSHVANGNRQDRQSKL